MKYCTYCGSIHRTNGIYCENCGHPMAYEPTYNPQPQYQQQPTVEEKNTFWWGVLGFFVPIAGLVIFLIWLKEKPKSSKSAGIGALIRVGVTLILTIIMIFFGIFAVIDESSNYDNNYRNPYYNERYYDDDWT